MSNAVKGMVFDVFAIRDVKSGFLTPTIEQNGDMAIRNFHHACLNAQSLFYTHPEDYSLYRIGTYDVETGTIEPAVPIVHLVDASVFFKKGE